MCTTRSSQRSQFGSFTDFRSVLLPFTTGTNVLLYSIIFLFIHASVWKQEVWRGVNHTLTCEIAERVGCHKQHCGRWSEPILNLLTASLTRRSHIVTLPCSEKRKAETNTFFFCSLHICPWPECRLRHAGLYYIPWASVWEETDGWKSCIQRHQAEVVHVKPVFLSREWIQLSKGQIISHPINVKWHMFDRATLVSH